MSFDAVHFIPKKCNEATTCSLSFILLISGATDSISKAKGSRFSGLNCIWDISIHFFRNINIQYIFSYLWEYRPTPKIVSSGITIQFLINIYLIKKQPFWFVWSPAKPVLVCFPRNVLNCFLIVIVVCWPNRKKKIIY